MKNNLLAILMLAGALAVAGCSQSSDSGPRGRAATGMDSGSSDSFSNQLPSGNEAPSSRTP